MLLFLIAVIAWICISFIAALAVGRFIGSRDRLLIAEVAQHTPSLRDSKVASEEAPDECNPSLPSELLGALP
jgi:hypothetical protein